MLLDFGMELDCVCEPLALFEVLFEVLIGGEPSGGIVLVFLCFLLIL